MGKKSGNYWLNAVRKAFRSAPKDDEKRSSRRREENGEEQYAKKRGKKRWIFLRHFSLETTIQHNIASCANSSAVSICNGEEKLVRKQPTFENCGSEQRRAIAVAMATAAAAEAAVATAQAAVEIIRLTNPSLLVKEHRAAVVVQTIFRGYLARRALLALKGVVQLQALIRGHNVRKRAKMTLQCIQSLFRAQALVCDQRRRLSCEATSLGSMFSHDNSRRESSSRNVSKTSNNLDLDPSELEEIQTLIQKAKGCSLKQGKTLARALSQQICTLDEDQVSDNYTEIVVERRCSDRKKIQPWFKKDRNLCNQRDPIKTVEVDTSRPYLFSTPNFHEQYLDSMFIPTPLYGKRLNLFSHSPKTPSPSKIKSISGSPCYETEERKYHTAETPTSHSVFSHRIRASENSCPLPRPNYMAATASAIARVRSQSTPRQRMLSPSREPTGSVKKRLSFPIHDGHNADDELNIERYNGIPASQFGYEQRSNEPYYATE